MKTVSRREFVATTVALGAGAVLRMPAFALENQSCGASPAATSKAACHEVVEERETSTGRIQRGCGS
jgi:hypothetical protein